MTFWLGLLLLVLFAGGVAKVVDAWLKPVEKQKIHDKIMNLWYALGERDPLTVVQAPIRAVTSALDKLYGVRLFSWMAFRRASLFTLSLFAFALVLVGLQKGMPFSSEDLPWRTFDRTYEAIETVSKNEDLSKDQKPEVKAAAKKIRAEIEKYNNAENRIGYSIIFFPCLAAVVAALNLGSIAFARQTLAEMGKARSLVTVFSLGLGNFFISSLIYVVGFSLICVIATPFSWLVVWGLIACCYYFSWILATALLLPSVVVALFLSPMWIKVLAGVIIVHGALVIFVSIGALFLFPVRKPVRWVLLECLDRAMSSEKGFVALCAVSFAALGGLAVEIAKLLSGRSLF